MNLNFASSDLDGNITACAEGPFRVSGNLNIAALIVANAYNIQVQGGLAGNTGRAGPAGRPAQRRQQPGRRDAAGQFASQSNNDRPSVIPVEFLGFCGGSGDEDKPKPQQDDKSRKGVVRGMSVSLRLRR
jgi:hypothetical protein